MLPEPIAMFIALPVVALTLLVSVFWRQAVREDLYHRARAEGPTTSKFSALFREYARRREPVAVWVVAAIVSVLFVSAGLSKLIPPNTTMLDQFDTWGYPAWLTYAVGVLEFGAALVLTFRWSTFWSSLALGAVMTGAVATHIVAGDPMLAIYPMAMLAALSWLAYMRRPTALGGHYGMAPIWRSEVQPG